MKPKFHIIGGGINGLVSSLYIKKKHEEFDVYLHESLSELGGKLLGFDYEECQLYFDKGTHIFQESGNSFLDEIISEATHEDVTTFHPQGKGDIVGSIQHNNLLTESHFINLLNHPKQVKDVKKHIDSLDQQIGPVDIYASVSSELEKRFGTDFKNNYQSIFTSLFKHPPQDLSAICINFIGLTRVVLDDYKKWIEHSQSSIYRSVVGVPDQLRLPAKYMHNRKSFYPKDKGTKSLIMGLIGLLDKYNIKVIKNSKVQSIDQINKQINCLVNNELISLKYNKVLISSGVISATKLLNSTSNIKLTPPIKTTFFNVELNQSTLKDLFYFYNFDTKENFYRVTNYRTFSNKNSDKRITIECFNCEDDKNEQLNKILTYLKSLDFIQSTSFKNVFIEEQQYGFPVLTLSNLKKIKQLNDQLKTKLNDDMEVSGLGTGNFNFFQTEIILNSFRKIDKMID